MWRVVELVLIALIPVGGPHGPAQDRFFADDLIAGITPRAGIAQQAGQGHAMAAQGVEPDAHRRPGEAGGIIRGREVTRPQTEGEENPGNGEDQAEGRTDPGGRWQIE